MKLRFLTATLLFALVALTSCEKDDPVTPTPVNPTPTPTPSISKKLKKLTQTEGANITVYNLTYDAADRLLSYNTSNNAEYVIFSYDAQGNLTGIEQKDDEFKNIYSYTYQNNQPVSGLFKSWKQVSGQADELIEDDRLTYTVSNNKVTGIRLEMLQAGTETNLQLTYTGVNLTKVESQSCQFPYTANFSFGTHRPAFPKVSNYVLDQAGFSLQFVCSNEMLSASFDFPGTSFDKDVHTQYTYDGDGYVLTSDDGETQMVFEYE